MSVQGSTDDRFAELREVLDASIGSGADLGASVAVCQGGETVVDLWGGWADEERTTPWRSDTLVNVWSNTKTMTALCALVLVDRGELDVYAPVARYWPEFAAGGKEDVEVRHVLSHSSGVAGWDAPVELHEIFDRATSNARLATQEPWWKPGTASGYHGTTYGHLVAELVTRITGKELGEFFAEEIAGPLGADFHIGIDPAEEGRMSPLVPPPPLPPFDLEALDKDSPVYKWYVGGPPADVSLTWMPEWRRSLHCGAGNGMGNARSAATVQAVVSHGGTYNGVTLLSQPTIDLIFDEQTRGTDLCLGIPVRFGIGYALSHRPLLPYLPEGRICFWAGWGGSIVFNDLDRGLTFAYIMNKMEGGEIGGNSSDGIVGGKRAEALIRALYRAVG